MKNNLSIYFITVLILSCVNQNSKEIYDQYMDSHKILQDKNIKINNELQIINNISFNDLGKKLIFTGGVNCTPCIITLKKIQEYIDDNNITDIPVIYIGSGEEDEYFIHQVKKNKFTFPIIVDKDNLFIKENNLNGYENTAMLIDGNNRLVLVGSPLKNTTISKFYLNLIDK